MASAEGTNSTPIPPPRRIQPKTDLTPLPGKSNIDQFVKNLRNYERKPPTSEKTSHSCPRFYRLRINSLGSMDSTHSLASTPTTISTPTTTRPSTSTR